MYKVYSKQVGLTPKGLSGQYSRRKWEINIQILQLCVFEKSVQVGSAESVRLSFKNVIQQTHIKKCLGEEESIRRSIIILDTSSRNMKYNQMVTNHRGLQDTELLATVRCGP